MSVTGISLDYTNGLRVNMATFAGGPVTFYIVGNFQITSIPWRFTIHACSLTQITPISTSVATLYFDHVLSSGEVVSAVIQAFYQSASNCDITRTIWADAAGTTAWSDARIAYVSASDKLTFSKTTTYVTATLYLKSIVVASDETKFINMKPLIFTICSDHAIKDASTSQAARTFIYSPQATAATIDLATIKTWFLSNSELQCGTTIRGLYTTSTGTTGLTHSFVTYTASPEAIVITRTAFTKISFWLYSKSPTSLVTAIQLWAEVCGLETLSTNLPREYKQTLIKSASNFYSISNAEQIAWFNLQLPSIDSSCGITQVSLFTDSTGTTPWSDMLLI